MRSGAADRAGPGGPRRALVVLALPAVRPCPLQRPPPARADVRRGAAQASLGRPAQDAAAGDQGGGRPRPRRGVPALPPAAQQGWTARYADLVAEGLRLNPPAPPTETRTAQAQPGWQPRPPPVDPPGRDPRLHDRSPRPLRQQPGRARPPHDEGPPEDLRLASAR